MAEHTPPGATSATSNDWPLTPEQAIALSKTDFWKDLSARDIALFQLRARCLCMPFDVFHQAVETALGRPVWTHEIALNWEGLLQELSGEVPPPSFEAILSLISPEKRLIIALPARGSTTGDDGVTGG